MMDYLGYFINEVMVRGISQVTGKWKAQMTWIW